MAVVTISLQRHDLICCWSNDGVWEEIPSQQPLLLHGRALLCRDAEREKEGGGGRSLPAPMEGRTAHNVEIVSS